MPLKEVPMQAMILVICMLTATVWIPQTWADIYIWTDEDGVRHISNLNPPAHAKILLTTEEPVYDRAPPRAQEAADKEQALQRAQARVREREAQLERQEAELEHRIEKTAQKTQEALRETEERLSAVEARYAQWKADRSYAFSTITYFYRPYGYRHYRHKHPSQQTGYRQHSQSMAKHPFYLGAIHLPLGSIGHAPRRYRSPEARFSRPKPHGVKAGRPHGYPSRRRH
jgi:hypothetical protein